MGNKAGNSEFPITPQLLQQSCEYLIKHQGDNYLKIQVIKPIKIILECLRKQDPIQIIQSNLLVNSSFVKFIFHHNFAKQVMKMVQLFINLLEELNKKSLNFLKVNDVNDITAIADFILYFTNQKIISAFDSLIIRSDVAQDTKKLLKQLQQQHDGGQLQVNGNLVQKMSKQEILSIQKILRVTIMNFINLRLQMISRSQTVLKYFSYLQQSLFMLYAKLYFIHYGDNSITDLNQQFKSNMIIGSYFLSQGTSCIQPSLYQTGVTFLYSFLKINQVTQKDIKQLPSHLFKNLPVFPTHSLYEYILCTILFTLKYVKEGNKTYVRFACNRINSLKLVQLILKTKKFHNKTITYYLQQLCLQVKIGQIERACVYQIIQTYCNIKPTQSQIYKKFLEHNNLKYNIKFSNHEIKISKQQLLTQLQDDENTSKKQYFISSHKYVLQRILYRTTMYNFNDRLLWNQLLPKIINNKQDEEVRNKTQTKIQKQSNSDQDNQNQDNEQARQTMQNLQNPKQIKISTNTFS